MTYENMKHKQHYVWRYYLSAWAVEDLIWCKRSNKYYQSNIKDVAQQRDFYKIHKLGRIEIALLNEYINKFQVSEDLKDTHRKIVELFSLPHSAQETIKLFSEINGATEEGNALAKKTFDVMINNLEEELHADIESKSIEYLEDLKSETFEFWHNPSSRLNFLQFISLQLLRTIKIQQNISEMTIEKMPEHSDSLMKIWNPLRHMLATNIASNIFNSRFEITLILNETSTRFITSDQPAFNLLGTGLGRFDIPDEYAVYYPITPSKAILIDKGNGRSGSYTSFITPERASAYNQHVLAQHHEQLFARSKIDLDQL